MTSMPNPVRALVPMAFVKSVPARGEFRIQDPDGYVVMVTHT